MCIQKKLLLTLTAVFSLGAAQIGTAGSALWNDWSVVWKFHTDISLGYEATTDNWSIGIDRGSFGETGAAVLDPAHTILLATPDTIRTVPPNIPAAFSFLGEPGDTYYLFPFSEPSPGNDILYLGSNGYSPRLPFGVFSDNTVNWSLAGFHGPGDFFLYRAISGNAVIYMDTRPSAPAYGPGFDEIVGGHSHFNWIFREPGIYLLSFQAKGELLNGGTTVSEEIPFFYLVDPRPVDWWLVDQFREAVKNPSASLATDTAGDGHPNLLAYAFGFSPHEGATPYLPNHEFVERNGQTFLSLVFRKPEGTPERDDRSDLDYRVQTSEDLVAWTDITDENTRETAPAAEDGTPRVRVIDTEPVDGASRRFLRVVIDHQP